ncbi:TIGR01212 family radical SAM protein [Thermodesulfobacteriota bacterium]
MNHYNTFSRYLKNIFGVKVHKISVNAGMTCPNRDGSLSSDGCIFCDEFGSAAKPSRPEIPMPVQVNNGKEVMGTKYKAKQFLAYFQAYTNTYGETKELVKLYKTAVEIDDVVGLIIGTRPDCIEEELLKELSDIAKNKYVQIEYGLQSVHDKSLKYLNRHHTYSDFVRAYEMTRKHPEIKIGAHVILGIEGETEADMIKTATTLSDIGIDVVKIHQIHVIKGTRLEELFNNGELTLMSADEYVTLLVTFLEHLSSNIVIDRLIGDRSHDVLIAPRWSIKKRVMIRKVEEEFVRRNTKQGAKCEG